MDKKFINLGIGIAAILATWALSSGINMHNHDHDLRNIAICVIALPLGLFGLALFVENLYKIYESLR